MPVLLNTTTIGLVSNLTNILHSPLSRTNDTFTTVPSTPTDGVCDQTSLSAGSAAFILIALILGCITQPPGSLVTHSGNRFWRISPFLNLVESATIFLWFLMPSINEMRTFIAQRLPETSKWHISSNDRVGDMSLKVAAYACLVHRSSNSRNHDLWARQQYDDQPITTEDIAELIEEVRSMEKGATLRPAIILPMMLQFFKIVFIRSSGGALWKLWPMIYFSSWLSVEFLLIVVHGASVLTDRERDVVEREVCAALAVTEVQGQTRYVRPVANESRVAGRASSNDEGSSTAEAQAQAGTDTEENSGLLQQTLPVVSRPRHRIYFRSKRKSLKTIGGNPSAGFFLIILGRIAITLESYFHMLPLLIWVDMSPGWSIFLYMFLSLGPLVLMDFVGGFAVIAVQAWLSKSDEIVGLNMQTGMRDLVAFKTGVIWIVYYLWVYSSDGMVKPVWLDWLG